MSATPWLSDFLAVVMLVMSLYAGTRLLAAWSWRRKVHPDLEVTHLLMGVAMAGMLAPKLQVDTPVAWKAVFGAAAAWYTYKTLSRLVRVDTGSGDAHVRLATHYLSHAVMSYAMFYMYLAQGGRAGAVAGMLMSGTGNGSDAVLVPLVLVMVLLAAVAFELDGAQRLVTLPVSQLGGQSIWLAPRLGALCHALMCLTMGYALILLL